MKEIAEILQQVNVPCKDDGREFLVTDKLDAIASLLADTTYALLYKGDLCRIYSMGEMSDLPIVLISVHVDDLYDVHFCQEQGEEMWRGTFDNNLSLACVLREMLCGGLAPNVWVAFTGDEEKHGGGAKEVGKFLKKQGVQVAQVIVTEVTHAGWEDQCPFVIENDRNMSLGQAWEMFALLAHHRFAYLHDAEPDESEIYGGLSLPVLTLSIPVQGDMHSNEGCLARCELLPVYGEILRVLVNLFAEISEQP